MIEETEIDLESWRGGEGDGEVRTRSRNIDHKTVMQVWEWQNFKSCPEDSMTLVCSTLFFYFIFGKKYYITGKLFKEETERSNICE